MMKRITILISVFAAILLLPGCDKAVATPDMVSPTPIVAESAGQGEDTADEDGEYDFGRNYWGDSLDDILANYENEYFYVQYTDNVFGESVYVNHMLYRDDDGNYALKNGYYEVVGLNGKSGEESFENLLSRMIE